MKAYWSVDATLNSVSLICQQCRRCTYCKWLPKPKHWFWGWQWRSTAVTVLWWSWRGTLDTDKKGTCQLKAVMQMNIWKIIYLNCGERYDFMIHHRSYTHNLSSCEIEVWKKFRPERDSNAWPLTPWPWPMTGIAEVMGSSHTPLVDRPLSVPTERDSGTGYHDHIVLLSGDLWGCAHSS